VSELSEFDGGECVRGSARVSTQPRSWRRWVVRRRRRDGDHAWRDDYSVFAYCPSN